VAKLTIARNSWLIEIYLDVLSEGSRHRRIFFWVSI